MAREKFISGIFSIGAEIPKMRTDLGNLSGLRFQPFLLPVEPIFRAGLPVVAGVAIVRRPIAVSGFGAHPHAGIGG
jgi:hypothetical protein